MLARIGWYILFLLALVVYYTVITYGQKKQMKIISSKRGSVFLASQVTILGGLVPILVIPWILTGFFSKSFTVAILLAFEVSALLLLAFYSLFRITPREVVNSFVILGAELALKYPRLMPKLLPLFGLLVMVGYIGTASYIYFTYPRGSGSAVRGILSVNMALFLAGMLFVVIPTLLQIASSAVNNTTRRALFVSQAATALQMGVIFTVYLGLMGIGGERLVPRSLPTLSRYSQYIPMALLLALYLVIIIIPYFIGLESRRRKEILMYSFILSRITRVIDAVGIPSAQDVNQLTELRTKFKQETDAWVETEPIVALGENIEKIDPADPDLDDGSKTLLGAYADFKLQDPRLTNLSAIDALDNKLDEMIGEYGRLQPLPNNDQLHIDLNNALERHFRDQQEHYANRIKAAEDMKVLAPVLARLVAVVGAVPVVMQYGQRLIQILSSGH
jgi:hypothetical protein